MIEANFILGVEILQISLMMELSEIKNKFEASFFLVVE